MYKPGELEAFSMALDEPMKALENEIMSDIIRRIKINGEITRAADWQIYRLHELGAAREDVEKAIKNALNLSDEDMRQMYSEVIKSGYAHDSRLYEAAGIPQIPFEENRQLQQLISAAAAQTSEKLVNISRSLGFTTKLADGSYMFQDVSKHYQQTLDKAIMGIASGEFDYNTVIKKAVSELTNSGLRTVDYSTGRANRVDVAARRAIMTGLSQVTGQVNEANAAALGTDTYEVTWHGTARPSHQVWQGKWYTYDELVSVCGLGSVTGLHGANCYHDYYPVIPGISEPAYTAEQLERMNAEENKPVEYCGKTYTKYEASQRQRKLETAMRAQRQKIKLLEDAGADEDDIINARCKYRGLSQEYAAFSKQMKLPQQRQRVTVDGLGNIGRGKWKLSGDKVAAALPRGYKDRRNVGEKITTDELDTFVKKAESLNIGFGTGKTGTVGGFESYRGDTKVLDDILEHVKLNQPVLTKLSGNDKIIMKYMNLLDEAGRVDTEIFAMTKGRTVYLNKFMFDDSKFLADEYAEAVSEGFFVKGTDYRNIVDHEFGHIFARFDKRYISDLNRVCRSRASARGITKSEYVCSCISKYADDKKELCAEINSMLCGGNRQFAENLLKEAGLL